MQSVFQIEPSVPGPAEPGRKQKEKDPYSARHRNGHEEQTMVEDGKTFLAKNKPPQMLEYPNNDANDGQFPGDNGSSCNNISNTPGTDEDDKTIRVATDEWSIGPD